MKHNIDILYELEQTIDDLQDYLQPKAAELKSTQADLKKSLGDLGKHLNPELKKKTRERLKPHKILNRIDLALRKNKKNATNLINQNLDIEILDFEDTNISYIDFH